MGAFVGDPRVGAPYIDVPGLARHVSIISGFAAATVVTVTAAAKNGAFMICRFENQLYRIRSDYVALTRIVFAAVQTMNGYFNSL